MMSSRIWTKGNQILAESLTVKSTQLVLKSAKPDWISMEVISSQRSEVLGRHGYAEGGHGGIRWLSSDDYP